METFPESTKQTTFERLYSYKIKTRFPSAVILSFDWPLLTGSLFTVFPLVDISSAIDVKNSPHAIEIKKSG